MIRKWLAAATGVVLWCLNSAAFAAVIDFEPPPCLDCGFRKTYWNEDGFRVYGDFTHMGAGRWGGTEFNNGSRGAIRNVISPDSSVTLVHSTGKLFDLESVQIGPYGPGHGSPTVTFVGITGSGATVTQVFQTYGSDFRTYHFSDDFDRVQSVSVMKTVSHYIYPDEYLVPVASYDRFVVNAIPVPGAVWLMGSGLLTLAGWRRRRG